MKRSAMIILALLLLLPVGLKAQESVTSYVFSGGEYDNGTKGFTTSIGIATKLTGNVWALARTQVGKYGSLETDIGYFLKPTSAFSIAVLAGPSIDWIAHEGADPVGYLVGASGFVAGYMPRDIGVWVGAKYKFKFSDGGQTFYQDGWQGGIWLSVALGK